MPFIKRTSDPIRISQIELTRDMSLRDELEYVANHTLCGVIQQLSNLNQHASDMFNDLISETVTIINRSKKLGGHVDELKKKYKKWNKQKIKVSLDMMEMEQEKVLEKRFDQQVISPDSRPLALAKIYMAANPPPAISTTNQYRDDGKDGLKLYTDPSFFIVNWSSKMQENEFKKHKKMRKREKRKDGGVRPVKIKEFLMRPAAVSSHSNDKKKRKKKKLEGFSNLQWEKQHPGQQTENQAITRKDKHIENNETTVIDSKTSVDDAIGNGDQQPPVVMRRQKPESRNSDLPPPPCTDNETEQGQRDEINSLPPPPIAVSQNGDVDGLPPPPPPNGESNSESVRRSSAFPPVPFSFYNTGVKETERFTIRDSCLILPPPLISDDDILEDEMSTGTRISLLPLPPPPLDPEPDIPIQGNKFRSKRISTFVLPTVTEDNFDERMGTPTPDYPDIEEETESLDKAVFPVAPPPPPPPLAAPAPPPPPPPLASSHRSFAAGNNQQTEIEITSNENSGSGLPFDQNSLLAMKNKLKQAKKREPEPVKASTNEFDVHAIMNKAIELRKFTEFSSSEEDSSYSDSDSDWE